MRALAAALAVSPATVNSAYRVLRQRGLIIAEGRRGTRVAPRPALRAPQQPARVAPAAVERVRDLTIGLPDPALVPPVEPVLRRIDLEPKLGMSSLEGMDPDLLDVAAASYRADGIPVDAIGVVSGAFDGIERVLLAHLRPGDRVIIEDPAYTFVRDLLRALGLVEVPVQIDERGLLPEPLEAALGRGAQAMVVVPRAQNPLGAALDAERAAALRQVLEAHPDVLLVEDDHAGAVAGTDCATLLSPSTQRWAVIRSVSKVLHPDLRLALIAADETTIARVEGRQALGPRWVSHVIQAIVAELLRDPHFDAIAARARDAYTKRRQALLGALSDRGIAACGRSGLNVWVPVREEAPTVRALVDSGWLVMAGERFRIASPPGIRITIATLEDEAEMAEIAEVIAAVEHAGRARSAY